MTDPSTEDLRAVFDELVGAPRPSGDLAERARRRGTALRRQRLSVVTAGVATVTVLVVPSVIAVRQDVTSGFGAGSKPTATGKAETNGKPGVPGSKTDAPEKNGTPEDKQRSILGTTLGTPAGRPNGDAYRVDPGAVTAVDQRRIEAARSLLGAAFTQSAAGAAIDDKTGERVGTSATFRTASGGSVGILWTSGSSTEKGTSSSTISGTGLSTGGSVGAASGASAGPAKDTLQTLGGVAVKGDLQVGVKVLQPAHAPAVLNKQQVDDLVNGLLAAES